MAAKAKAIRQRKRQNQVKAIKEMYQKQLWKIT